jgi:hypothetical protein
VTFTLRSILADLDSRGWCDQQGVAAHVYQPFESLAIPHLRHVVGILAATPAADPIAEAEALVVAYRDSLRATP